MEDLYVKYNYPSIDKFKKILKANGIIYTSKEVTEFIKKQSIQQVHKPVQNVKAKQKYIVALDIGEMLQIDLLDYQKYSTKNSGNKYIFIAVDIFSRFAYAVPIKSKEPKNVLEAFKTIPFIPKAIFSDSGNEFKGVFSTYLKQNNVAELKAEIGDHHSLGVIDRFSKTFKTMIAKYMTAKNTTKYVDKIDDLLDAYNTTPHSSLGDYSPNQVVENDKAYRLVNKINLAKMKYNNERTRKVTNSIKIGDVVRIKLKKKAFQKGYEITYSKETFEVREIDGDKALLTDGKKYKIEDLQIVTDIGNPIETTEKDADDRAAKINRRLKKSGIFD
jgi:hypothetical protein